jgi:hypothetical protein
MGGEGDMEGEQIEKRKDRLSFVCQRENRLGLTAYPLYQETSWKIVPGMEQKGERRKE